VRLRKGEGGLRRPSVVNVTQIATVDRARVETVAGRVTPRRLLEIWEGLRLVLAPPAG
jgi:mRNA-degrading endonuclease toxin of MazEF toxin-antitoxin module